MYIVFTSIRNKYELAVKKLVESIPDNTKYIVVFQNEEREEHTVYDDGHIEISIKNNLYELGSYIGAYRLIELGLLPKDDWYLFIHDTCKLNTDSIKKAHNIIERYKTENPDIIWLSPNGQCNLCLVRFNAIKIGNDFLEPMLTIDKMIAIDTEWGRTNFSPKRYPVKQIYSDIKQKDIGKDVDVYNNGTKRIVTIYNSINMEKYFVAIKRSSDHPQKP